MVKIAKQNKLQLCMFTPCVSLNLDAVPGVALATNYTIYHCQHWSTKWCGIRKQKVERLIHSMDFQCSQSALGDWCVGGVGVGGENNEFFLSFTHPPWEK